MSQNSIANKLSELFDLYNSGALTKEEYESLKSQLLIGNDRQNIESELNENNPSKKKNFTTNLPKTKDTSNLLAYILVVISAVSPIALLSEYSFDSFSLVGLLAIEIFTILGGIFVYKNMRWTFINGIINVLISVLLIVSYSNGNQECNQFELFTLGLYGRILIVLVIVSILFIFATAKFIRTSDLSKEKNRI